MALVFLQFTGKNEDIIDAADAEVEISQDAVHQALKGAPLISQAKEGVVEGTGTKRRDDCCLDCPQGRLEPASTPSGDPAC